MAPCGGTTVVLEMLDGDAVAIRGRSVAQVTRDGDDGVAVRHLPDVPQEALQAGQVAARQRRPELGGRPYGRCACVSGEMAGGCREDEVKTAVCRGAGGVLRLFGVTSQMCAMRGYGCARFGWPPAALGVSLVDSMELLGNGKSVGSTG